jgi:hypothetical protein
MTYTEAIIDSRKRRIQKRRRALGFAWVFALLAVGLWAGSWLLFLGIARLIKAAASVWMPG